MSSLRRPRGAVIPVEGLAKVRCFRPRVDREFLSLKSVSGSSAARSSGTSPQTRTLSDPQRQRRHLGRFGATGQTGILQRLVLGAGGIRCRCSEHLQSAAVPQNCTPIYIICIDIYTCVCDLLVPLFLFYTRCGMSLPKHAVNIQSCR